MRVRVLVAPRRSGDELTERRYETAFASANVELVEFGEQAASRYASIRALHAVRPPDAMHLACASVARVDLFVTNDSRLHRLDVPGIDFISGLDRVPM
jgi:predicted nucleic acid-binding protein